MQLQDILYSQGFGIRRVCSGLVQQGWVELWDTEANDWVRCLDSTQDIDPEGLRYRVQGVEWAYHALGYVLLHKPAGTECSQKPSTYRAFTRFCPCRCASARTRVPCRACRPWAGWTRTRRACCCSAMMASSSTA